jgi:hypothetical protein
MTARATDMLAADEKRARIQHGKFMDPTTKIRQLLANSCSNSLASTANKAII